MNRAEVRSSVPMNGCIVVGCIALADRLRW
jgi:hypothetical protein